MSCTDCGPSCQLYATEFGDVSEEKFYSCRGRDFHPNALDHFYHPKNSNFDENGNQLLKEDNINIFYGTFGEFSKCGDQVEVWIKLTENHSKFEEITWCSTGCAGSISSASFASELLKGTLIKDFNIMDMMKKIRDNLHLMNGKEHCASYPLLAIKDSLKKANIEVQ